MTNPMLKNPEPTFLFVDHETFSLADLKEVGLDNYVHDPSTGVSMTAWAVNHEDMNLWLPHLGPMPERLVKLLLDPSVTIVAWNANFEKNIYEHVLHLNIQMARFRDPMIIARSLSLPGKLENVAQILKMGQQKDPRGDALKEMFCKPVSKGGEMTLFGIAPPLFRDHNSHPKEFAEYGEYCIQDVRAMRDLWYRLSKIPFPDAEWQGWLLDQKINSFGMPGRRDLAEKGLRLALKFIDLQRKLLKEKTGLENPNSDQQMKEWLSTRGYPWNSLRAPTVQAELKSPDSELTPEAREALKIRSSARKNSYTKLEKFLSLLSTRDDRLRYQFRYLGASRTGRWASGGGEDASVQVQNLPRGEKAVKKKLDLALQLLDAEDYEGIVREFTSTPNPKDSVTVVEFVITLLRSMFQAKPGKKFLIADKNAIENRVLGWAAGCPAILDVFRTCDRCDFLVDVPPSPFLCPKCGWHKARCPYLSFGTNLYNKTYQEMRATYTAGNEEERQNSKPPVLGGGYGLGGGDLYFNEYNDEVRGGLWGYALTVCGVDMPQDLAHKAVAALRKSWPEVVQFWTDLEEAFKHVLKRGGVIKVGQVTWDRENKAWVEHHTKGQQCVLTFRRIRMEDGGYMIRMELPSGRALHYLNATLEDEVRTSKKTGRPYTVQTIYYDGVEHSATQGADGKNVKKHHKWGRVKTYGGKLVENAVQAISRDDLLHSMTLFDEMGGNIFGLFHDELACEESIDVDGLRLDDLVWCMTQVPPWAPGLPLGAEGFESAFYRKG